VRLIAHRGASAHAPENTMASFRLALGMGAKAIELDVHQTRDGELVVLHDDDFKRVGRRRLRVRDLAWGEVSSLEVGAWFDPRFKGERVPRLAEVMDLVEGQAELHIELKRGSRAYPGIEERLVELVGRRRAWAWAPLSSFDHGALYRLRSLAPRARLGYLLGLTPWRRAARELAELGAESLNLSLRQVDERKIQECHRKGRRVLVYTVNTLRDLERLRRMGVDGVFTNFPELDSHESL